MFVSLNQNLCSIGRYVRIRGGWNDRNSIVIQVYNLLHEDSCRLGSDGLYQDLIRPSTQLLFGHNKRNRLYIFALMVLLYSISQALSLV